MCRPCETSRLSRRALLRGVPTLLLPAFVLPGCWNRKEGQPVRVVWDRDVGEHCGMIISDRRFAAQVIEPGGAAHKFDDIGCLLAWLDGRPFADTAHIWVRNAGGTDWLDARQTRFRPGALSPMGYGYLAAADPQPDDLDFTALRAAVLVQERQRLQSARSQPGRPPAPPTEAPHAHD